MEKVAGLQENITKTLLELKTNATTKLTALKDNVDRRMAQSLVASLTLFTTQKGGTFTSSIIGNRDTISGRTATATTATLDGSGNTVLNTVNSNSDSRSNGGKSGIGGNNISDLGGEMIPRDVLIGKERLPRPTSTKVLTRDPASLLEGLANNSLVLANSTGEITSRTPSPNMEVGVQPIRDYNGQVDQGNSPRRKRMRRDATVPDNSSQLTSEGASATGTGSISAPKESLRSSLVLPTDNLPGGTRPDLQRETGDSVGVGLESNMADLEFLLHSYRIDVEELLINQHLLTATSDINTFLIQLDNIAVGELLSQSQSVVFQCLKFILQWGIIRQSSRPDFLSCNLL